MDIFELIDVINDENQIDFPNKFSPIVLIASEILKFKSSTKERIKNEQFIEIPYMISFIIKLLGDSV